MSKIESKADDRDSVELSNDEARSKVASREAHQSLDEATELKLISIRLPTALIEELKIIADVNEIGYQPLVRKVLRRFARAELRAMAIKYHEQIRSEEVEEEEPLLKAG